jgi:hypothetical protein
LILLEPAQLRDIPQLAPAAGKRDIASLVRLLAEGDFAAKSIFERLGERFGRLME